MSPNSLPLQVRTLDRALLALIEERVRLSQQQALSATTVEDLLRRAAHTLDADALRELFRALDRLCGVEVDS